MKIESKIQFPDDRQPDRIGSKKALATSSSPSAKPAGLSSPTGEDTVSLSGAHSEIQRLSAAAQQVPEIRVERVNALQRQLRSGQFSPDQLKIADALIAEQSKNVKL
jgi:flagellar biosynthesis anti-sigma factor FlgM